MTSSPHRRAASCVVVSLVLLCALAPAASGGPHDGWRIGGALRTEVCLGCHDGTIGANVSMQHPIGVDYEMARRTADGSLRPITALPGVIRLEGGLVGCTGCHDPWSPLPSKLVTPHDHSRLCFGCHDK